MRHRLLTTFVLSLAVALLVGACSSADGGDTTTTTMTGAGGGSLDTASSTTTAPGTETTTTAAVTTTETPTSDLASCVVGTWDLDSEAFLALITEGLEGEEDVGEFVFGGGTYRLFVGADGTFVDERSMWTLLVASDFGNLTIVIDDRNEGTYTLDGDLLSTTIDMGEPPDITFFIDDLPVEFPEGVQPVEPPAAEFTGAVITCSGDSMSATFDGFTSTWTRTG